MFGTAVSPACQIETLRMNNGTQNSSWDFKSVKFIVVYFLFFLLSIANRCSCICAWDPCSLYTFQTLCLFSFYQNQYGYQDHSFNMEEMLANLPRVLSVPPVSGGCLPPQDLPSGFSRGNQDDPRCNGTMRKQASPRSSTLGPGSVLVPGPGKAKCFPIVGIYIFYGRTI